MLTDKQIANMRKMVRWRWVSPFLYLMSAMMLASALGRVYIVKLLCERTGITWAQVWKVTLSGADLNTIYVGAELKAQELIHQSVMGLILAIVLAVGASFANQQRSRDILLLEYIDKTDKGTGPVSEEV
jgi:hypothetical protein